MAYIDWDFAEIKRIDAQVESRVKNNPKEATRRGVMEIWQQAEEDARAQSRRYI
jgi:hypothetical protein